MSDEKLRLDKWLWAARFYKTRALAASAVSAGRVQLNQQRVKPAREIHCGDELRVSREGVAQQVVVLSLASHRGPAKQAVLLYQETAESIQKRELHRQQQQLIKTLISPPKHKPDKKQRRQLLKIRRQE